MEILQWNIRGLRANFEELKAILNDKTVKIACLQETKLRESDTCSLKGFDSYQKSQLASNDTATGGAAVLVRRGVPHQEVALQTSLQSVAVTVNLHVTLTICSIYLPPGRRPDELRELDNLVSQLPPPFLILGDFNAHSDLWGEQPLRPDGKIIEDFISNNDLNILNDGSNTYLHPGSGSWSAIDLSLCTPSIYLDFTWTVFNDQHGSDHFPILLSHEENTTRSNPRWVFKRAAWDRFQSLCEEQITEDILEDPDPVGRFTEVVVRIAEATVPKSSCSRKARKPWFNEECKAAIKKRRASLQRFSKHPTDRNLQEHRQSCAEARRVIRASQRTSWRDFVSKLNTRTPVKKAWDMVAKISGKYRAQKVHFIHDKNGQMATDHQSIAEALAGEFASGSSASRCSAEFQSHRNKLEEKPLNFNSRCQESYNNPLSLLELVRSLHASHDTAVGPDEVHYQILKHLPNSSLLILLDIFNNIWLEGTFPPSWRRATTIPVAKPGKDPAQPGSYRPIALTSCVCKTMERMVNGRLVWFLESGGFIASQQSGFRSQRSTMDHLVSLETYIRDGFARGCHVVSIFFDLEKAYDTTWKHGIMMDLHSLGLRGHLPRFIQGFLTGRSFRVRLGTAVSGPHSQEMGVPQGSVLSVTLFSIKINSIVNAIGPDVHKCLYVDDYTISYSSRYMASIERKLQTALYRLTEWANKNGFRFSVSKTVCVHFCNRRGLHPDPELFLNNSPIPVVEKTKFLGLMFDNKLNFRPHIAYLRVRCQAALQLLRTVSKLNWGADRETLLRLFRSLIRSRLDYGAAVYGSARPSYLLRLKPVQNQALRLCLGAFRTSPIVSLHVEAFEPPMEIRRLQLGLQYAVKVSTDPDNPAHSSIFNNQMGHIYRAQPRKVKPLAYRIEEPLSRVLSDPNLLLPRLIPADVPYWDLKYPETDTSMTRYDKNKMSAIELRQRFYSLLEHYPDHFKVYTDGSKSESAVACAATAKNMTLQIRLNDKASIYTAELTAILESLNMLQFSPHDSILLITDSLSALDALHYFDVKHHLVAKILSVYTKMSSAKDVVFLWCPSHVGIGGNERADLLAKQALSHAHCAFRIPFKDLYPSIKQMCRAQWQSEWEQSAPNKLLEIVPEITPWSKGQRTARREEVVLARARIGHTHLTHSYLLKRELAPECYACSCPLTVKHVLIECADFIHIRRDFYRVASMKQLFTEVKPTLILSFLKAIGLFYRF